MVLMKGPQKTLWIRDLENLSMRQIAAADPSSTSHDSLIWSPDSRKLVYSDKRLNLWLLDLDHPTPVKIDTDRYDSPLYRLSPAWSPDSQTMCCQLRSWNSMSLHPGWRGNFLRVDVW